jgi:hypothetical protein
MGITIMSATEYTTIARTPLNQLHTLPLHLLCAYLYQCPAASRRALERIVRIH